MEDESHGSTKEVRRRAARAATRMVVEAGQDPATKAGAIKRISDQLGMHPETLRDWVRQAKIDGGVRPGTTTDDTRRLAELAKENRELKRANEMAD